MTLPTPPPLVYVKHNAVHMLCEGCLVFIFNSIPVNSMARQMRGAAGEVHQKGKQNSSKEGGWGSTKGISFSGLHLIFEKLRNHMQP